MSYALSQYPARIPDDQWRENYANGWGRDQCWPHGVNANLRGNAYPADGTALEVRKELVPLVQTLTKYTEEKVGYKMTGGGWTGGYNNRPIGGTRTPSAHSRARAIDMNAVDNPQSWNFKSAIPPEVITAWTQCGFYWGGWYNGVRFDTMHVSYNLFPSDVAGSLARAEQIYGGAVDVPGINAPVQAPKPVTTSAPPFPLAAPQVFGLWNQPAKDGVNWAKLTRSGDDRWDGPDVRTWIGMIQERLNHYYTSGSPALASDGYFGAKTARDVRLFQAKMGLAVDGMVGPMTWMMLWS